MRPIIMATACLMAVSFTFSGCDVKLNKQYWSLITNIDDDGISAIFVDDSNQEIHCRIPYREMKDDIVTVYIFRTPDEEMSYTQYKADKISDILERTVLKYDEHPKRNEDERYQTQLERMVDENYIIELCKEQGIVDFENHDELDIERLYWLEGHQYRVTIRWHNGNQIIFDVNIGGQIL